MLEITRENLRLRKLCFHFLLVACLLLLPGCYVTEFNADGSGELTRFFIVPGGANPQEFCPKAGRGFTTTVEGRNCNARAHFANLSQLRELYEAAKWSGIRINQLEKRPDGKLIHDISVDSREWAPDYMPVHYWELKMPGNITSHNAYQREGNTLRWGPVNRENGVFRVYAESQVHQ